MGESRIFLCKNVKDVEMKKKALVEKLRMMVSPDVTVAGDTIVINKTSSWTISKGTINISKKGSDLELLYSAIHNPTNTTYLAGCVLFLLTLIFVVVAWYLYDKDSKDFDASVTNALSYVTGTE